MYVQISISPSNAELNPICHLLVALLGAHHILHVSGVRVKLFRDGQPSQVIQRCSVENIDFFSILRHANQFLPPFY